MSSKRHIAWLAVNIAGYAASVALLALDFYPLVTVWVLLSFIISIMFQFARGLEKLVERLRSGPAS